MGLDMYMHARRDFDPTTPVAENILAAAGKTLDELIAQSKADPMEEETSFYLSRWKFDGDTDETRRAEAVVAAAGLMCLTTDESAGGYLGYDGGVYVSVTCAYWRKANAIHSWLVQNVQNGVDDCGEYPVSRDALEELRKLAQMELDGYKNGTGTPGQILVPTSGFFFGSTTIDDGYAYDMEQTIKQIDKMLSEADNVEDVRFFYQSSW